MKFSDTSEMEQLCKCIRLVQVEYGLRNLLEPEHE
jgi:hypothetical protein